MPPTTPPPGPPPKGEDNPLWSHETAYEADDEPTVPLTLADLQTWMDRLPNLPIYVELEDGTWWHNPVRSLVITTRAIIISTRGEGDR